MRYLEAHAAKSGSVPFALRGPKSARTVLATAVAAAIGLVPAVMVSSPAFAATTSSDVTIAPTTAASGGNPASDTATEGGTVSFTLTYTGSATSAPTDLTWSTADGTASANSDYTPVTNQPITFTGTSTKTAVLQVQTLPDLIYEGSETFKVNIYDPSSSTTTIATANATVADDDVAPVVTLAPIAPTVPEGNNGWHSQAFTLRLNHASKFPIAVAWTAAEDNSVSASDGDDFRAVDDGMATFAAGTTAATINVDINGDLIHEGDETFTLDFAGTQPTTVPNTSPAVTNHVTTDPNDAPYSVTIVDDDAVPTASMPNQKVVETDSPWATLVPIQLSNPTSTAVSYTASDLGTGTATANVDYKLITTGSGGVAIPAGETTGYAIVVINGDKVYEPDETVKLKAVLAAGNVSNNDVTPVTDLTSTLTIQNDDQAPAVTINDTTVAQGASTPITVTTTGSSANDILLNFSFTGGTAGSTAFTAPTATTMTIPAGTASGTTLTLGNLMAATQSAGTPDKTVVITATAFGGGATIKSGTITIKGNAPAVTPTVNIPGSITGAVPVPISGKATPGATVDLWGAPWSSANAPLVKILTTKADSKGMYSFSRWIGQGFRFKVAVGDWTSTEHKVTVNQAPTLSAVSSSKGTVSFTVTGNPKAAGQDVIVQRWVNGKWTNAWKGTTGTGSQFKATAKVASKTVVTVRAWVGGDAATGIMAGTSVSHKVTVK